MGGPTAAALIALSLLAGPAGSPPPAGPGPRRPLDAVGAPVIRVVVRLVGPVAEGSARGLELQPAGLTASLRARAAESERVIAARLESWLKEGRATALRRLWIVNGFAVTATADVVRELEANPAVVSVTPDAIDLVPLGGPAEPGVAAVGAPELWALSSTGAGVDVAILDSGVDAGHPDLAPRWRGGAGAWFDPYGEHASPHDPTGHGTWVAGIVAGGDAGGTSVGVAPGARLLAAKIFPDSGPASASAIHEAFEWVLDPDGDPATDDAPAVVNGSWGFGAPGCQPEFQDDLRALRAAGILPVFAAGNQGPGASTGTSPGNYPEALSVGAVDASGAALAQSGRGPSACDGGQFPSLSAPGAEVWTTDLLGGYLAVSGTSAAAPHVSGAAALLAGAFPDAGMDAIQSALVSGARDLGTPGPDPDTGLGLVDVRAAYEVLLAASPAPVAVDDAFEVLAGTAGTFTAPGVLANDRSAPGASLAAVLAAPPGHGTLALRDDGGFDYAPEAGFAGADSFRYRAAAGGATSAEATVRLEVPLPQAPSSRADGFALEEDGRLSVPPPGILANDTAPEGRSLVAVLVSQPPVGLVRLRPDGAFDYRPAADYAGVTGFTYAAWDGTRLGAPVTVTLAVGEVNDPPLARGDLVETRVNTPVEVQPALNDVDVDGRVLPDSLRVVTGPRHGSLWLHGGRLRYAPRRHFRGSDHFEYRVSDDGGARSNPATVWVRVR